jgi:DNA primase
VYPDSNSFYCFGCGAGGDGISFLMRMERLDYIEAVKSLSERVGMQLPDDNYDDSLAKKRLRILAANREAAKFFHANLKKAEGREGLDYWLGRRKLSTQMVTHFGLGYALPGWTSLLDHMRALGYTPEELEAANLARRSSKNDRVSYFDNFRHRVMVPILDLRGNVVAFGGRVLDDSKPKYINTSDTLAYKKGRDIFALNFAKNAANGRLILCEGYMDVIALHQHGFTQAVACLGTALTREQAQLLTRYCGEVVLSYDADEAGQKAVQRALQLLEQTNLKIRVLRLSGGKDPDEILNTYGAERFRQLLEGAANDIEFRLLRARGELDLGTPAGKTDYLREAVKVLVRCGAIERDIYAGRLAEELAVSKDAILTQINLARKRDARREERDVQRELMKLADAHSRKVDAARLKYPAAAKAEERILGLVQRNPEFYLKIRDKLRVENRGGLCDCFVTPFNWRLAEVLFDRLEVGQSIEPECLTGVLHQEELDELMRMRVHSETVGNPLMEFEDCVRKLQGEKEKAREINVTQMDQDAYLGLFQHLKQSNGG